MKDIDFDELDRAVNSLMSSVDQPQDDTTAPSPQASASVSPEPVQAQDPITPVPAPAIQPVASAPSAVEPVPIVRPSAPAARRSGRFMDMVSSPSAAKPAPASVTPSREGLAITPRQAPASPVASTQATPAPDAGTGPVPVAVTTMPDPLDMVAPTEQEETPPVLTPETSAAPSEDSMAPLESPFLTDAKVEKRPLNPGTSLEQNEPLAPEPADESASLLVDEPSVGEVSDEPKKGEDEPPTNPQVPELDSDLVAIESNEQVEKTQSAPAPSEPLNQPDAPAVPLGASSIAQQYKTSPSTGDQSHAAIYDASQYPQPVAHPAKHRSSWWWVLWVLLLLGVGAGGAVLMYNLGIIP